MRRSQRMPHCASMHRSCTAWRVCCALPCDWQPIVHTGSYQIILQPPGDRSERRPDLRDVKIAGVDIKIFDASAEIVGYGCFHARAARTAATGHRLAEIGRRVADVETDIEA